MKTYTKILTVLLLLTMSGCWLLLSLYKDVRADRTRLQSNQRALLSDIDHYKFRDSLNAASIQVLTLRTTEFEKHFSDLNAIIKELGVKLKRVELLSQTAIESRYEIQAPVRDTIFIVANTPEPVIAQTLNYRDSHISLEGLIINSRFRGAIKTTDTLTQIVHRIPKKFLFFKWGTKELRQEILSSNPYSNIIYNQTIKIPRR